MSKRVPKLEKRLIFKRLRGQQTLEALFMAQKEKEMEEEEEKGGRGGGGRGREGYG